MFRTYTLRPATIQAIQITADNHRQVADWIADQIADDRGVHVIAPGTVGKGVPRLSFHPRHAATAAFRSVPIPGYLAVYGDAGGDDTMYTGYDADDFDGQWAPAGGGGPAVTRV